jgi:hypothetical protein
VRRFSPKTPNFKKESKIDCVWESILGQNTTVRLFKISLILVHPRLSNAKGKCCKDNSQADFQIETLVERIKNLYFGMINFVKLPTLSSM